MTDGRRREREPCTIGGVFSIGSASEIIVEIASGEGGADSKLFVGELASAYIKYARSENLTASVLASSEGHTVLKVTGDDP